MQFRHHLKIGSRLGCGFGIVVTLMILLGTVAIIELNTLANVTAKMYNHPLAAGFVLWFLENTDSRSNPLYGNCQSVGGFMRNPDRAISPLIRNKIYTEEIKILITKTK